MNRRQFLDQMGVAGVVVGVAGTSALAQPPAGQAPQGGASASGREPAKDSDKDPEKNDLKWPKAAIDGLGEPFPSHDPALVQEIVAVSHANLARVTELVQGQPALAKASWDWGFGDWETALGAASHTGRRAIAELLLANGAPATIFSAAMLGQLDVVKGFIAASPGIERQPGPHGIPLLAHARAGGGQAAAVVTFLDGLGTADRRAVAPPLEPAERAALVGRYVFGPGPRDVFIVDEERNALGIRRAGATRRGLVRHGGFEFSPVGSEAVRIRFVQDGAAAVSLKVSGMNASDAAFALTARRSAPRD